MMSMKIVLFIDFELEEYISLLAHAGSLSAKNYLLMSFWNQLKSLESF